MKSQAELFRVLADEERLRIICLLLAEPEGACVCELVDALRMPQYQVSRQLGVLRNAGLVEGERQGTWIYYRMAPDLPPLARTVLEATESSAQDGFWKDDRDRFSQRLRLRSDGLCTIGYDRKRPYRLTIPLREVAAPNRRESGEKAVLKVLFVCTHNSARSQMAEAWLRHYGGDQVEAFSAGTEASSVHPLAIRAMAEVGIDISGQTSKSVDQFLGQEIDFVITVCDQAREACPVFPGAEKQMHWSFPDPAAVEGSEAERLGAFRQARDAISARIGQLVSDVASAVAGEGET